MADGSSAADLVDADGNLGAVVDTKIASVLRAEMGRSGSLLSD